MLCRVSVLVLDKEGSGVWIRYRKFLLIYTAEVRTFPLSANSQLHPLYHRWIKSSVSAHLINHTRTDALKLFYWRQGNYEVDFVLEHKGKIIGLEIKSDHHNKHQAWSLFVRNVIRTKFFLLVSPLLRGRNSLNWIHLSYSTERNLPDKELYILYL